MASAVASEAVPVAALLDLKDFLASPSAAASARGLANLFFADSDDDDSGDDEDTVAAANRRHRAVSLGTLLYGDTLDVASKANLLLALANQEGGAGESGGRRRWWVSKADGDAVQLKVPMPGLGKEHVKMRAEKDVLVIKGGDKGSARYSYRIRMLLSFQAFKMDQIKAEMKHGMLTVTVPRIKDEERKEVFEIKIE